MARGKDTKARMAGVERLHEALEKSSRPLTSSETASLVDCCLDLLKDGNFRVAQGGLQALSAAAVLAGEHFKIHLNSLVPATVDRLGDGKQPVRDAARQLLVTLMEVRHVQIIKLHCRESETQRESERQFWEVYLFFAMENELIYLNYLFLF